MFYDKGIFLKSELIRNKFNKLCRIYTRKLSESAEKNSSSSPSCPTFATPTAAHQAPPITNSYRVYSNSCLEQ